MIKRFVYANSPADRTVRRSRCRAMVLPALAILVMLLLTGCGTTRRFNIQSDPEGALVTVHNGPKLEDSLFKENAGVTPVKKPLVFLKGESRFITVEKRGYEPATLEVSSQTRPDLAMQLERIPDASTEIFDQQKLQSAVFVLLPVEVEVTVHSGVGRLDKRNLSPEKSQAAAAQLDDELLRRCAGRPLQPLSRPGTETIRSQWQSLEPELQRVLLKLDAARLDFTSRPTLLRDQLAGFGTFCDELNRVWPDSPPFLLFVWARCTSETKGRKTGNLLLGLLGAAASGAAAAMGNNSFFYDPSAFNPDSGTLAMLYVIDARTTEVVHIEPHLFGHDLTKADQLARFAEIVANFPTIDRFLKKKK
jgi:hypothetical protein